MLDGKVASLFCGTPLRASSLFIPISLGNHYYTKYRLKRIIHEAASKSIHSVFFLCDELRRISYRLGGEQDDESIDRKVHKQVAELKAAIGNSGGNDRSNISVWTSEDITDQPMILKIEKEVFNFMNYNDTLRESASNECRRIHNRLGIYSGLNDMSLQLECEYLSSEVSLSLYMNEYLKFDYELYRKNGGFIDLFYSVGNTFIASLFGKTPQREFVSIERMLEA